MTLHYNRSSEKEKRKHLRNSATKAERVLWQHLRGRQLGGFKFRRQYSIDTFIVDFYCPEVKLAIELDGDSHFTEDAREYDAFREKYIETFGVTFLRFTNVDVYRNIEGVLRVILGKLGELKRAAEPPPNPIAVRLSILVAEFARIRTLSTLSFVGALPEFLRIRLQSCPNLTAMDGRGVVMSDIVAKLWGFCHTLRHDGIDYGDYIEQLTYLLFLKMADEKGVEIPENATRKLGDRKYHPLSRTSRKFQKSLLKEQGFESLGTYPLLAKEGEQDSPRFARQTEKISPLDKGGRKGGCHV